ncbi:MAG TPA: DUF3558 domain-containing protein [Pseudonocardia sp.]|nr:DUF3558 domain-containing protein [Pseudonocardia sp.]
MRAPALAAAATALVITVGTLGACSAPAAPPSTQPPAPPAVTPGDDAVPPELRVPEPKDARGIPVCDLLTPGQLTALGLVPETATERRDGPAAECTWAVAAEPGDRAAILTRIPTEVPALVGYYRIRDVYADFEPITVSGHPGFRYSRNPGSGCVHGIAIADHQYLDTSGSILNPPGEADPDPCSRTRRMAEMVLSNLPPLR